MQEIVALIGALGPAAAALVVRAWKDRRDARAFALQADLRAAANRVFGGDTFLTVTVRPSTWWRTGRVLLATPRGWEWLIEAALSGLMAKLPHHYELVWQRATRR